MLCVGGFISSCIDRFDPGASAGFVPKLVIEANIVPDDGVQEIVISYSSTPDNPDFIPVSGCQVRIEDEQGRQFPFPELGTGRYRGVIKGDQVVIGHKYRLFVLTPEGKTFSSSFEELLPCPTVDSVYYELYSKETSNNDVEEGVQFLIDLKANENYGRFFRWELVETYEYHASVPLQKWLDSNGLHQLPKPDFSHYVCYKTENRPEILILSTHGFSQNSYKKFKLHFVDDRSQRLLYQYSLLVKQYSISQKAYNYWQSLKKNNQEAVDMFGKQPANVTGNISNEMDTTERALGNFTVSLVNTKRIMVHRIEALPFKQLPKCLGQVLNGPLPSDRPLYFSDWVTEQGDYSEGIIGEQCIFCELFGGTTLKPAFWNMK